MSQAPRLTELCASLVLLAACGAASLVLLACGAAASREADRAYTAGLAEVSSVAAEVSGQGDVPLVVLHVEGWLPDPCTQLEPARTEQRGYSFEVTLPTRRPFGATCAPDPTPFTTRIRLPTMRFASGSYAATVNGVSTDFAVIVDPRESEVYRPGLLD